jgi:hypothetical protein
MGYPTPTLRGEWAVPVVGSVQKAPQTLQNLVADGRLREVPINPMTGANVRSVCDRIGLNGTLYSNFSL